MALEGDLLLYWAWLWILVHWWGILVWELVYCLILGGVIVYFYW